MQHVPALFKRELRTGWGLFSWRVRVGGGKVGCYKSRGGEMSEGNKSGTKRALYLALLKITPRIAGQQAGAAPSQASYLPCWTHNR